MENKKFRLFISQPMSGLSIEKITEDRQRGYEYFKSLGVTDKEIEVIDNLQEDAEDYIATDYLSTDIKLLGRADGVLFLKGWENARGCKVEYMVAKYYVNGDIFIESKI